MPVWPCWEGRTVCSGTAPGTQLPSSSAKPLQAQRRGKDVKCFSPSHHHIILICSLMISSWKAIKQRKSVSFGLRKLDLPCCREGHLSAAAVGQLWGIQWFCTHTVVCFPNWEQQQPCSWVFWRWNQRTTGFNPEKGQKSTASPYHYKILLLGCSMAFPSWGCLHCLWGLSEMTDVYFSERFILPITQPPSSVFFVCWGFFCVFFFSLSIVQSHPSWEGNPGYALAAEKEFSEQQIDYLVPQWNNYVHF